MEAVPASLGAVVEILLHTEQTTTEEVYENETECSHRDSV